MVEESEKQETEELCFCFFVFFVHFVFGLEDKTTTDLHLYVETKCKLLDLSSASATSYTGPTEEKDCQH